MGVSYTLELPWPPSVNRYWRTRAGSQRPYVSEEGRQYRHEVRRILHEMKLPRLEGELWIEVVAFPPDYKWRDIDNLAKSLYDSLQAGGLFEDDCQIGNERKRRASRIPGGQVLVTIGVCEEPSEVWQEWQRRAAAKAAKAKGN